MKQPNKQNGFSILLGILVIIVVAALGLGAYYTWQHTTNSSDSQSTNTKKNKKPEQKDETVSWTSVTSQQKAIMMKVPDGWKITSYPGDFLGAIDITYKPGIPASTTTSDTSYQGHLLRFRASIEGLDDAGLGPQWASPQPGLKESSEKFSIGSLIGKRFKGVFTGDLDQTVYQYVFSLGSGKKLEAVYTVQNDQADEVATVEKALHTIKLIQ